jgi:hypothetical protein
MAGLMPNEGKTLAVNILCKRVLTDRDADLELGLFTNSSVGETTTLSAITEPTGTGYARKTLTDASWTILADTASYAKQTFTGGAGGWTGSVYGYFIATKAAGGTPRLLALEVDPSGPYTINENDTYDVTPTVTAA